MTVVALCSAKGAPGVTTLCTALGAVWPVSRSVAIVECDPSGGDLAARFGLSARRGTTSYVLSQRDGSDRPGDPASHTQALPGGIPVLVGPLGGDAATAVDGELSSYPLCFSSLAEDVLLDCGRVVTTSAGQGGLLRGADVVLVVVTLDLASIGRARLIVDRLTKTCGTRAVSVVVSGESAERAKEAAAAIGAPLAGSIPRDPEGAALVCGSTGSNRALARSKLIKAATRLVGAIGRDERDLQIGTQGSLDPSRSSTSAEISRVVRQRSNRDRSPHIDRSAS